MTTIILCECLVSVALQVAVIVLVAEWLCRLDRSAAALCRLWKLTFLVILVLTAIGFCTPHPRWLQPWNHVSSEQILQIAAWQTKLGAAVVAGWLLGAIFVATRMVVRSIRVSRFIRTCRPFQLAGDWNSDRLNSLRSQIDLLRIELVTSPHAIGPFCTQFHQAYIVVPEYLFEGTSADLENVLAHELAHLATGHPLELFLQRVVEVVFWFHPSIRRASRHCSAAREFLCDEAAAGSPDRVVSYLKTLHRCAEATLAPVPAVALSLRGCNDVLSERIERLVDLADAPNRPTNPRQRAGIVPWIVLCSAGMISLIWLPMNPLASSRGTWSPWPSWSARVLQAIGTNVRDYEYFDPQRDPYEIDVARRQASAKSTPDSQFEARGGR